MISIFWISYIRTVIAIRLFLKVYWTDDCFGLSAKSQLLYGITLLSSRLVCVIEYYIRAKLIEIAVIEVICILVTFCTALLMLYPLKKTYEAKYDTVRIELLIIPCIVLAVWVNYEFGFMEMLLEFSVYLESLAMIPQFQFTKNTGRIRMFVVVYVVAMVMHDSLYVITIIQNDILFTFYWIEYDHYTYYYSTRLITLAIHILSYCYFFFWILPWLICCKKGKREEIDRVEVSVEKGEKCGYQRRSRKILIYCISKENFRNEESSESKDRLNSKMPQFQLHISVVLTVIWFCMLN